MTRSRKRVTRRHVLQAGAGSLFIPFALKAGKAPAQGGKKPFEGVTLNISCWSATYPKLIADYLPEFIAILSFSRNSRSALPLFKSSS